MSNIQFKGLKKYYEYELTGILIGKIITQEIFVNNLYKGL